jgi:hypothetical protein
VIRILIVFLLGTFALASHSAAAKEWGAPSGWEIAKTRHSYANLIKRLDAAVKAKKMGLVTRAVRPSVPRRWAKRSPATW